MKTNFLTVLVLLSSFVSPCLADTPAKKVRLFILSGQSNMVGLKEDKSFTPIVTKAFPDDEVIVVKYAEGGQPIRFWYKGWKTPADLKLTKPKPLGYIYDILISKVNDATKGKASPTSVTFVWMQGEADAKKQSTADLYADSLKGLLGQLQKDLGRDDIDFVLGRLSDCGNPGTKAAEVVPGWMTIREAQVKFVDDSKQTGWVDTDDLNGKGDGLHYDGPGVQKLGERFAAKAIELIQKRK
ncbi:hypothetical protein BH10PLA1_BH10PLA1_07320 [soil metagenome]